MNSTDNDGREINVKTKKSHKCKTPGCNKPHHAHGYCQNCYDEMRKKNKASGRREKIDSKNGAKKSVKLGEIDVPDPEQESEIEEIGTLPPAPVSKRKAAAAPAAGPDGTSPANDPAKSGRLGLIRMRHEAMKREIDQIREDLESEGEE